MQALAAAALQELSLRNYGITGRPLKVVKALITAAPYWPKMQLLDLAGNNLGPDSIKVLLPAGQHWKQLKRLDPSGYRGLERSHHHQQTLWAEVPHWASCLVLTVITSEVGS